MWQFHLLCVSQEILGHKKVFQKDPVFCKQQTMLLSKKKGIGTKCSVLCMWQCAMKSDEVLIEFWIFVPIKFSLCFPVGDTWVSSQTSVRGWWLCQCSGFLACGVYICTQNTESFHPTAPIFSHFLNVMLTDHLFSTEWYFFSLWYCSFSNSRFNICWIFIIVDSADPLPVYLRLKFIFIDS